MDSYTPDDEVEKLKAWWTSYGNALIAGVLLGAGLLVGINYWRHYKTEQANAASLAYDRMVAAVEQKRGADAQKDGEKLMQDYRATPYAGKAGLILARLQWDSGNADAARQTLERTVKEASEAVTRRVARLRLARLLLDKGDRDAAWKLVQGGDTEGFAGDFAELRGDLLVAQGKPQEARVAYREALAAFGEGSTYAQLVKLKLDNLGPETP